MKKDYANAEAAYKKALETRSELGRGVQRARNHL